MGQNLTNRLLKISDKFGPQDYEKYIFDRGFIRPQILVLS